MNVLCECVVVNVYICMCLSSVQRPNRCLDLLDQLGEGNLLKGDYILVGGFLSLSLSPLQLAYRILFCWRAR